MWKSIIDANGGLTTQPDSIYGKLGINVNLKVINDATQSSNALIKGDLNAAGYTINRTAFLSKKFKEANKLDPNLDKQVEGIKIAKPIILVGCVYYMLIPFISTFLADIADHNPKLDIPHKKKPQNFDNVLKK